MKHSKEAEAGLRAMERAAKVAHQRAALHGLKVPIWSKGRIEYIDPQETAQQSAAANTLPRVAEP